MERDLLSSDPGQTLLRQLAGPLGDAERACIEDNYYAEWSRRVGRVSAAYRGGFDADAAADSASRDEDAAADSASRGQSAADPPTKPRTAR